MRFLLAAVAAAAVTVLSGCVERELRVESDPPGAQVFIDGEPAGTTPYRQEFVFYGTRRITLRLDGYEPEERVIPIRPPWFQWLPMDFFFEVLWPWTLHDRRSYSIPMTELLPAEENELIERARKWREEAKKP